MGDAGQQAPTGTLAPKSDAAAVYDRTIETAFSLAFRITGDRTAANAACESAYAEAFDDGAVGEWDRARELALLAAVRSRALELRPSPPQTDALAATYQREEAVRDLLAGAEPAGRRAVELCYFGGMTAEEAADVLGMAAPEVRASMRRVLLALGASVQQEGSGR